MKLKVTDHPKHAAKLMTLCRLLTTDNVYDKSTFHIKGCISHYNCRIFGLQQLHEFFEYGYDTPKVNIHALQHDRMVRCFCFVERTITGDICLDLLEQLVPPPTSSIEIENAGGGVFQQDGTLPNFYMFTML